MADGESAGLFESPLMRAVTLTSASFRTNQSRGSGLLDELPPTAGLAAARAAYDRLSEHDQTLISEAARVLLAACKDKVGARSVWFGEAGALEVLAAVGRMLPLDGKGTHGILR